MNARCTNTSLFIVKQLNRKYPTFCVKRSIFENAHKKLSANMTKTEKTESIKHLEQKYDNQRFFKNYDDKKEVNFSSYLSSGKHDPDSFGSLSEDWKTHQQIQKLPEEEDDIVVKEFFYKNGSKGRLTINQYGRIIKKFLEQNKVSQAIEVLETRMLKDDRVQPESYIYNLLIGACGKVGYTKKAFNLHKQMRVRGLKVTGHTYTGMFNACANSPFPEDGLLRAQHLRATLVERAFLMNQTLYHAMIKAFGRCGDMETAFLLVDEMIEKKIRVSDETFSFLLQACITNKPAGFRQALLVWRKMLEKRVKPTLFTFNLLLRCSRDCGMGDETSAELVVKVLLQAGQMSSNRLQLEAPTEQTATTVDSGQNLPSLISPQPTMGDVMVMKSISLPEHRLMLMGGSSGFLKVMEDFNVKPDIKTFTQLLDQIPSTLSAEIDLLDRIQKLKVPLDCDFCNMLIRKRAMRGDYENAKIVLRLINEEKLKPNMLTFGVLAMVCQDITSARQLLDDIDKLGYSPNIEILGTLVKNACYRRDCDFIIEIMKIVEEEKLKPNPQFFKHLDKFYKFASGVLKEKLTDNTGMLNGEKFDEFCKLYQSWRREMKPDDPPHPWEQFTNKAFEPEDLELMNYNRPIHFK